MMRDRGRSSRNNSHTQRVHIHHESDDDILFLHRFANTTPTSQCLFLHTRPHLIPQCQKFINSTELTTYENIHKIISEITLPQPVGPPNLNQTNIFEMANAHDTPIDTIDIETAVIVENLFPARHGTATTDNLHSTHEDVIQIQDNASQVDMSLDINSDDEPYSEGLSQETIVQFGTVLLLLKLTADQANALLTLMKTANAHSTCLPTF